MNRWLPSSPPSPSKGEPRKIVVSESFGTAVRRSLFHLLPITTSTAILAINIHGFYIGVDFSGALKSDTINLMLLQLAAKAQEIMIVASLGLIVLHAVRYELLFGDGLPLGLIGSGVSFSNFEFFFKKEFYGALRYVVYQGNKPRKIGFVALLVLSGLTSLLAGPASAVLLVPKTQGYPAGGTQFFLDGSALQFWPEDVSVGLSELQLYCSSENSTSLGICPAGGFLSLWERWNTLNYTNFIDQNIPPYAADLAGSRFYWPVHSPESQIPPLYAVGNPRLDNQPLQPYTWLVQAHAASATVLQHIAADWWEAVLSHLHINPLKIDDRNVKASVPSVISAVRCADAQNISASKNVVQFPTIEGRWDWAANAGFTVETLESSASNSLRFQWVHLPDEFGTASIGAVFETPWLSDNNSRVVVGCSAQTGWVPTDVFTDSYTFWSGWYPWGIQFGGRTPAWTAVGGGQQLLPTNGRIALSDDWLELLTPPVPTSIAESQSGQASTIESILGDVGLADITEPWNGTTLTEDWLNSDLMNNGGKTRFLEAIICSILADGLSRYGSHRVFNTTGPNSAWPLAMYNPRPDFDKRILKGKMAFESPSVPSLDLTTLQTRMQISGFSYQITLAGYLSMVVLLTHGAMALFHISWVLFHKQTSRSWNSIAELVALSQNSQPAFHSLGNTGGGIKYATTSARVAKVRVRPQPGNPHLDHIELVFEDFAGPKGASVSHAAAAATGASAASSESLLSLARKTWTFPLSADRSYESDVELESGTGVREGLIPKVRLADEGKGRKVCVNQKYS
jgi:hypothetical protein